jgi:hypothetical protein
MVFGKNNEAMSGAIKGTKSFFMSFFWINGIKKSGTEALASLLTTPDL